MAGRLFNFVAYLSFLLCVLTTALWVRSCYATDRFSHGTATGHAHFISNQNGWVEFYFDGPQDLKVLASHGSVILGTALLPVIRVAAIVITKVITNLHAQRRQCDGRCRCCGYDLRATPDRCPECGTVPEPAT